MMQFWIAALVLLALTGFMVMPTLLGRGRAADVDRAEINRDLHRKELAELDAALASGELDASAYDGARTELERRVLEAAAHDSAADAHHATTHNPRLRRLTAAAVLIAVPVSAILGYQMIGGGPNAFNEAPSVVAQAPAAHANVAMGQTAAPSVAELTERLAQRLKTEPTGNAGDGNGWLLLARSYHHLGRTAEAQAAYAQARDHGAADAELAALLTATDDTMPPAAPSDQSALQARVAAAPQDGEAWLALAQAYRSERNFPAAAEAFAKARALLPASADLLADHADVLAAAQDRKLDGAPGELIEQALALDADHPKALWLAATLALQRNDTRQAKAHWQHLLQVLPDSAPDRGIIERNLAALEAGNVDTSGADPAAATPAAAVRGVVDISPELRAKVTADDTVFIFARAANGPPMPLAVLRKQVRDLPYEFVLDDSLAMQPQLKLSGFDQVMLGARVSRSGTVTQQPGEPRGDLGPVSTHGAAPVRLTIDHAGS